MGAARLAWPCGGRNTTKVCLWSCFDTRMMEQSCESETMSCATMEEKTEKRRSTPNNTRNLEGVGNVTAPP